MRLTKEQAEKQTRELMEWANAKETDFSLQSIYERRQLKKKPFNNK